jgi:hypothetical protein
MQSAIVRRAAAAALWAALAAGCGSSGGGGGASAAGPAPEPAVATDDDLGAWVDDAAVIVVADRCAGRRSVEMEGPAGRLRVDDELVEAAPGAATCRVEERFEAAEDAS